MRLSTGIYPFAEKYGENIYSTFGLDAESIANLIINI